MDIPRPSQARKRRFQRIVTALGALALIALITVGLSRLKPAAPTVDKTMVLFDVVRRGEMVRQVRGNGRLVPEQIQMVQTETDGRVERILVLPGEAVKADTILVELSNPELVQSAFEVGWQLKAAEAQLAKLKVQLESDRLTQEAAAATMKSELTLAELDAQTDEELSRSGVVAKLVTQKSRARADELKSRYAIDLRRLKIFDDSLKSQLAVPEAEIAKLQALSELKHRQVASLRVQAGIEGVLQSIGDRDMLQVGQRVTPASTLAKVVQPSRLKAEIKIPETQAKDIQFGQIAMVDTRNGMVSAKVIRIDPAAQNGYVTVDLALTGPAPKGARPDMNVEGTIELERLKDVLYVGNIINSQGENLAKVFKVVNGGKEAARVRVKLGRSSVTTIEILEGLQVGDQIIVSDVSQWDAYDRVRLN